jgi:hypothetical protein
LLELSRTVVEKSTATRLRRVWKWRPEVHDVFNNGKEATSGCSINI